MKLNIFVSFVLLFIGFAVVLVFAQEELTITTYYPSPFGSYQDLQVSRSLRMESVPINANGPDIEWRNGTGTHWNIDQDNTDLRFFTELDGGSASTLGMALKSNGNVEILGSLFIRQDQGGCIILSYGENSWRTNCPPGFHINTAISPPANPTGGVFFCCR